jgi:hypothetical protein
MKRIYDRVKHFLKPTLTVFLGDCRKCHMLFFSVFYDADGVGAHDGRYTDVIWGTTCELFLSKVKFRDIFCFTLRHLCPISHISGIELQSFMS